MLIDRRLFLASTAALSAGAGASFTPCRADDQPPASTAVGTPRPSQDELDRSFSEKLSGSVFSGRYSVTAGGEENEAVMEKYEIAKVAKVKDDQWHFTAKWKVGRTEIPIVLPLTVKWAGDTPVITLDELTIPGVGTFSSRVLIHGDWYAGTWRHGKVGGHLWGRVEKSGE